MGWPSASRRPVTTPMGSTDGVSRRMRSCSSRYSWMARCSMTSLAAYTESPTLMNRTTWREIPRGRATRYSAGQSANGVSHGRGSSRESGLAERKRGTGQVCHHSPLAGQDALDMLSGGWTRVLRRASCWSHAHRFTTFVALAISCWKSECRLSRSFLFLPIQDFWYSVSREY